MAKINEENREKLKRIREIAKENADNRERI